MSESQRTRGRRLPEPAMATLVAIVCVALVGVLALVGSRAGVAGAQLTPPAGSPVASPAAGPCEAPEGTPAATEGMAAEQVEGTPLAGAVPEGTPVENAMADEAIAAAENFVNCWNAGEFEAALALVTPTFVEQRLNVDSPDEALELLEEEDQPQFTILARGNVLSYDDGRTSVDIIYLFGEHQYVEARWFMVTADEQLLIDQEAMLPPRPEGETSAVISFSIAEDAEAGTTADENPVAFDQTSELTVADIVTLHGVNNGEERHIFTLVQFGDDPTMGTPAADEFDPTQGEFVGQLSLAGGEQGDMVLLSLQPGVYVLYDPAVEGSVAPLTIVEPAA